MLTAVLASDLFEDSGGWTTCAGVRYEANSPYPNKPPVQIGVKMLIDVYSKAFSGAKDPVKRRQSRSSHTESCGDMRQQKKRYSIRDGVLNYQTLVELCSELLTPEER